MSNTPSWISEGASAFMAGSGQSLGGAQGTISIDTSRLERDKQVIIRTGKEIGSAFTDMGRSVGAMGQRMSQAFQGIQGYFGLITTGGLAAARQIQGLSVTFNTLIGSEEGATTQLAQLRAMADRLKQPFLDVAESARGFLTITKSTNADLNTLVSLAQRLRVVDPTARVFDTSVALREFVSGNIRSLVARFEGLQPQRLRTIMAQADGDVQAALEGLSDYLSEIGATEEALVTMGKKGVNAFAVLRSEVTETLGTAFQPLLEQVVIPLVTGFGNLARAIREANPALLQFAGTMVGLIGASGAIRSVGGLAGLLGFGGIGRLAPWVGRAAVGVAGVAVAQQVGRAVTEPGSTSNQSFQGSLGDVAARAITTLAVGIVQGIGVLQKLLATVVIKLEELGTKIQEAIGNLVEGIGNLIITIAAALSHLGIDTGGMVQSGNQISQEGGRLSREARNTRAGLGGDLQAYYDQIDANVAETSQNVAELIIQLLGGEDALDRFTGAVEETATAADAAATAHETTSQFTEDQIAAWVEFQNDLIDLDNKAADDRKKAAEDRDKGLADAEKKIVKDQEKRESDTAKQLAKSRAAAITEAAKNEDEIRASFAEKELERQRENRVKLLNAAAQLDAWGVYQQLQANAEQKRKNEEGLKSDLDANQERLDAKLQQEEDAAQERLQEARDADQEYLTELRDRLQQEYNDKIAQINAQLEADRNLREQAFITTYNALAEAAGQHATRMLNIQNAYQGQAEAELTAWWNRMVRTIGQQGSPGTGPQPLPTDYYYNRAQTQPGVGGGYAMPEFAAGGFVAHDMIAKLHGGEFVMTKDQVNGFKQIGDVSIYITEPGASAEEIGAVVNTRLAQLFAG